MLFYYFLHIFQSDFAGFLSVFRVVCRLSWSPTQELEPGATPCRGGRCAAAILADRSSRKTKKYFDYDKDPADGVEPSQGPCRARDRVGR